jgi:hypothetical protein
VAIAATVTLRPGRHLAATSRGSVARWACAVGLLGHAGNLAIAVAGIGLPVAAAHRLVDCDATQPGVGDAGSSRIGHVAGPCQQIAELPSRAGHPGDAAAGFACAPARAASPGGAAGSHGPAGSRGAAGSRRTSGSRGTSSSRGPAGSRATACCCICGWACAVGVLGHAVGKAHAVVAVGLPVAAAHGLVERGANLRLGHAGASKIAAAMPWLYVASFTGRAGQPC